MAPCGDAQTEVGKLKVPMRAGTNCPNTRETWFPADKIKELFQKDFVLRILDCDCRQCEIDRSYFRFNPDGCADKIVGHATSVFALLAHRGHPMLIIGILYGTKIDELAVLSTYTREHLMWCWRKFYRKQKSLAEPMLDSFDIEKYRFLVGKIDGGYLEYGEDEILPFTCQERIGKIYEDGEQAQGNFGSLFKFEIPEHYRNFERLPEIFGTQYYNGKTLKFARKQLHNTNERPFWTEKENLEHIQKIIQKEPNHFVQMLKAYRHGAMYNIIFPCAEMNLDDFFRDPNNKVDRNKPLRENPLWKEMLGICRALKHMVEGQVFGDDEKFVGYHFDLKPANILIFAEHTWQIADFGQSVFRATNGSSLKLTNPGGTDEYAPPENVDLGAKASAKYDVWSMGCILLELITFLVTKGSRGIRALDKARHTSNERGSDHRLWTKTSTGQIELKPKIIKFTEGLLAASGPSEQHFLTQILELTNGMLEPDVGKRFSASRVVEMLKKIVENSTEPQGNGETLLHRHATALAVPLRSGPSVSSHALGIEDLGSRRYIHLGWRSGTPAGRTRAEGSTSHSILCQLQLDKHPSEGFETLFMHDPNSHDERSRVELLNRRDDMFVPLYAFDKRPPGSIYHMHFYISELRGSRNTENNRSKASEAPSLVKKGLMFAKSLASCDELTDVLLAQALFTMQEVVQQRSYRLESVRATEYGGRVASVTKGAKSLFTSVGKKIGFGTEARSGIAADRIAGIGSSRVASSSPAENSSRAVMVQIWREQNRGREPASRRRVVVFKSDGSMFVLRVRREWRESTPSDFPEQEQPTSKCVTFVPTTVTEVSTFSAATLLRRGPKDLAVAGIPMHPEELEKLEDQDQNRNSYTDIQLTFASETDALEFQNLFKNVKEDWKRERKGNDSAA